MSSLAAPSRFPAPSRFAAPSPVIHPAAVLVVAGALAFGAQSLGGAATIRTHPANLLFALLTCISGVLSWRRSAFTSVVVWLAAGVGVRCLYSAQPMAPLPVIAWARGMGVDLPMRGVAAVFSESVVGVGQLGAILAWTAALGAAGVERRAVRATAAVVAFLAAILVIGCLLLPEPTVTNQLSAVGGTPAASSPIPVWVDGALAQQVWTRTTHDIAPGVVSIPLIAGSEMALSAIAEGMAMSTHGPSVLRELLWAGMRLLTGVQLHLRILCMIGAGLSMPMCVGLLFRSASRARVLALPGLMVLALLATSNVLLVLLASLLPEGGASALRTLPFHLALLGFVAAAALATQRLITQEAP